MNEVSVCLANGLVSTGQRAIGAKPPRSKDIQTMEDEQENTIQKNKKDNKLSKIRNTTEHTCCIFEYLLYFQVFVIFSHSIHRYFDSCTTPN